MLGDEGGSMSDTFTNGKGVDIKLLEELNETIKKNSDITQESKMGRKTSIAILLATFLAFGNVFAQEVAQEDFNKGLEYLNTGNNDEAIRYFTKAIEINPNDAVSYNKRSDAYIRENNYDQAILDSTKAIEINPKYSDAYCNRGFAYENKGNFNKAILDYNKAIEINPKDANAYFFRGIFYSKRGNRDKATADFNKMIEINPKAGAALLLLGFGGASTNKSVEPIRINPHDAFSYFVRGRAYSNAGNYDLAISDFSKAIEINPNYRDAYVERAVAHYYKKEYDKAWIDVHKAEALGSKIAFTFVEELKKASGGEK